MLTPEKLQEIRERAEFFREQGRNQSVGEDFRSYFHSYRTGDILDLLDALEAAEARIKELSNEGYGKEGEYRSYTYRVTEEVLHSIINDYEQVKEWNNLLRLKREAAEARIAELEEIVRSIRGATGSVQND